MLWVFTFCPGLYDCSYKLQRWALAMFFTLLRCQRVANIEAYSRTGNIAKYLYKIMELLLKREKKPSANSRYPNGKYKEHWSSGVSLEGKPLSTYGLTARQQAQRGEGAGFAPSSQSTLHSSYLRWGQIKSAKAQQGKSQ